MAYHNVQVMRVRRKIKGLEGSVFIKGSLRKVP